MSSQQPESGDTRVGLLEDAETCYRCGGENVIWSAPSPLWNKVMRGNDINGDPQYHDLVCTRCFIVLAFEAGIEGRWRLSVTPEPDGLIYETPSGRIWDPEDWLWKEPAEATRCPGSLRTPRWGPEESTAGLVGVCRSCGRYVKVRHDRTLNVHEVVTPPGHEHHYNSAGMCGCGHRLGSTS